MHTNDAETNYPGLNPGLF